jgi:hypothetical protein
MGKDRLSFGTWEDGCFCAEPVPGASEAGRLAITLN